MGVAQSEQLTVSLLLIALILVMKLPKDETVSLGWKLGLVVAIMVTLGYSGEIQYLWFAASGGHLPWFALVISFGGRLAGLNAVTDKQPESVKGLMVTARYLTVPAWLTYLSAYIIKNIGLQSTAATTYDLIWAIASGKSADEEKGLVPK